MKSDICYKLLGFLITDYKAYEVCLKQLGLKGYELIKVNGVIGKFKKVQPRAIQYYVDIRAKQEDEEYLELCKSSGWEEVGKTGAIRIYKGKEGMEAVPIHTDPAIEYKHAKDILMKREGYLLWFVPFWIMLSIANFGSLEYRDLLSNMYILIPVIQIMIAILYGIKGIHVLAFLRQYRAYELNGKNRVYSVKRAKIKRNIEYIFLGFFIVVTSISLFGESVNIIAGALMFVAFMIVFAITLDTYIDKKQSNKKKFYYTLATIVLFMGTTHAFKVMVKPLDEPKEILAIEEKAQAIGALGYNDFNGFEDTIIKDRRLEEGSSLFVETYYMYTEYPEEKGWLEVEYYSAKGPRIAKNLWGNMVKSHTSKRAGYDYYNVEKVASGPFDVDEAYYNDKSHTLLLKKDKEILYIACRDIDVWEEQNVEVIKRVFKE